MNEKRFYIGSMVINRERTWVTMDRTNGFCMLQESEDASRDLGLDAKLICSNEADRLNALDAGGELPGWLEPGGIKK